MPGFGVGIGLPFGHRKSVQPGLQPYYLLETFAGSGAQEPLLGRSPDQGKPGAVWSALTGYGTNIEVHASLGRAFFTNALLKESLQIDIGQRDVFNLTSVRFDIQDPSFTPDQPSDTAIIAIGIGTEDGQDGVAAGILCAAGGTRFLLINESIGGVAQTPVLAALPSATGLVETLTLSSAGGIVTAVYRGVQAQYTLTNNVQATHAAIFGEEIPPSAGAALSTYMTRVEVAL